MKPGWLKRLLVVLAVCAWLGAGVVIGETLDPPVVGAWIGMAFAGLVLLVVPFLYCLIYWICQGKTP